MVSLVNMKNNLSRIINKIAFIFKKEIMLSVSLLAAVVSLFITPPQLKLLHDIDWKTLATLFMLLSVLEGFKKEQIFDPLLKMTRKIGGITGLTFFFVFSVFFSSMFVTNDVSLIIFVPMTIILFRMGKKEKYTKEELVGKAVKMVRENGINNLGIRSLADYAGVSTQPICRHFGNIKKLNACVLSAINDLYEDFLKKEVQSGQYPPYKASGIGYVNFARKEPELFKALFMRSRKNETLCQL